MEEEYVSVQIISDESPGGEERVTYGSHKMALVWIEDHMKGAKKDYKIIIKCNKI